MNGLKWIYAWDDLGEIHSPEKFNYDGKIYAINGNKDTELVYVVCKNKRNHFRMINNSINYSNETVLHYNAKNHFKYTKTLELECSIYEAKNVKLEMPIRTKYGNVVSDVVFFDEKMEAFLNVEIVVNNPIDNEKERKIKTMPIDTIELYYEKGNYKEFKRYRKILCNRNENKQEALMDIKREVNKCSNNIKETHSKIQTYK
jgi:hypothetical protein